MENQHNLLSNDLQIDDISIQHLRETSGWAKFLGILGFVFSGFIVIVSLTAGTLLAGLSGPFSETAGAGAFVIFFYLIAAGITFMISLFVYRFGTKTKAAIASSDQHALNDALKNLRFTFRTQGIIACIYLGILVLALIFGTLAALMRS